MVLDKKNHWKKALGVGALLAIGALYTGVKNHSYANEKNSQNQEPKSEVVQNIDEIWNFTKYGDIDNWTPHKEIRDQGEVLVYDNPVTSEPESYSREYAQGVANANLSVAQDLVALSLIDNIEHYKKEGSWNLNEEGRYSTELLDPVGVDFSKKEKRLVIEMAEELKKVLPENRFKNYLADVKATYKATHDALKDERNGLERIFGINNYDDTYEDSVSDTIKAAKSGYSISSNEKLGVKVQKHNGWETGLRTGAAYITAGPQWLENKVESIPIVNLAGDGIQNVFEGGSHALYHVFSGFNTARKGDSYQPFTEASKLLKDIPENNNGALLAYNGSNGIAEGLIDGVSGTARTVLLYKLLVDGISSSSNNSGSTSGNDASGQFGDGSNIVYGGQ